MNATDKPSTTDPRPVLRSLPTGYDDPASPWFLDTDPEVREEYLRVPQLSPAQAKLAHERAEEAAKEHAGWRHYRAVNHSRGGDAWAKFCRQHMTPEGQPRPSSVRYFRDLDDDVRKRAKATGDELALAEFVELRSEARASVQVRRRAADEAEREAARLAHEEQRRSCQVCGNVGDLAAEPDTSTRDDVQACAACWQVADLLRTTLAQVPNGDTRTDAVAAAFGLGSPETSSKRPSLLLRALGLAD